MCAYARAWLLMLSTHSSLFRGLGGVRSPIFLAHCPVLGFLRVASSGAPLRDRSTLTKQCPLWLCQYACNVHICNSVHGYMIWFDLTKWPWTLVLSCNVYACIGYVDDAMLLINCKTNPEWLLWTLRSMMLSIHICYSHGCLLCLNMSLPMDISNTIIWHDEVGYIFSLIIRQLL